MHGDYPACAKGLCSCHQVDQTTERADVLSVILEDEIVGPHEIAERLGVELDTVGTWRRRGVMPEPFRVFSSRSMVWKWAEVKAWAEESGRLGAHGGSGGG